MAKMNHMEWQSFLSRNGFYSTFCNTVDPTLILPHLQLHPSHSERVTNTCRNKDKHLGCQELWNYLTKNPGWVETLENALKEQDYSDLVEMLQKARAEAEGRAWGGGPEPSAPSPEVEPPPPYAEAVGLGEGGPNPPESETSPDDASGPTNTTPTGAQPDWEETPRGPVVQEEQGPEEPNQGEQEPEGSSQEEQGPEGTCQEERGPVLQDAEQPSPSSSYILGGEDNPLAQPALVDVQPESHGQPSLLSRFWNNFLSLDG